MGINRSTWASVGLLLVLLLGIGVVVWGSRWVEARKEAEKRFSFPDTQAIQAIQLVELHGDTVYRRIDLRRTPKGWYIGDTLEAFIQPVQTLLQTLTLQSPRASVPETALRNVLRFLKEHRIEVTLHFTGGRTERFYVGGPTPDQRASYMLKAGADQPYEVFIPGFEGYLTSRYYPDLSVWQPNILFTARAAEIQAVQVDYLGEPGESWRLERPRQDAPWQLATGEPIDSLLTAEYFLAYTGKFYADDMATPDSLAGLAPTAEMQILLWSGKKYYLIVYPHPNSPLHYYVRLLHSPYFVHTIGRHAFDRLLYRRAQFIRKTA